MSDSDEIGLPTAAPAERKDSLLRSILETVLLVVAAFALAMGIKTYVVQPFLIPSGSMERTLLVGDRVLVNKFIYRMRTPHAGDVVVFLSPEDPDVDFIKRVVAVAGQTVEVKEGVVYVDGVARTEPFVDRAVPDTSTFKAVTVPAGYVWLMGDNRSNSRDSRFFGPRPVADVLGQAFCVYWPLDRVRPL